MGRTLELDSILSGDTIELGGKEYKTKPVSVEALLKVTKLIETFQSIDTDGDGFNERAKVTLGEVEAFVSEHVPGLPTKDLPYTGIIAIVRFLMGGEGTEKAKPEKEGTEKKEEAAETSPSSESQT